MVTTRLMQTESTVVIVDNHDLFVTVKVGEIESLVDQLLHAKWVMEQKDHPTLADTDALYWRCGCGEMNPVDRMDCGNCGSDNKSRRDPIFQQAPAPGYVRPAMMEDDDDINNDLWGV